MWYFLKFWVLYTWEWDNMVQNFCMKEKDLVFPESLSDLRFSQDHQFFIRFVQEIPGFQNGSTADL